MTAAIIIPARYASTRLPGKPLLAETGKTLIQHVYERAAAANNASCVIVATDDDRIFNTVRGFGGDAVMTSPQHTSGTARVEEAARSVSAEIIVNLQGDEPEVDPADIDNLIEIQKNHRPFASTLAAPFSSAAVNGPGSPLDPAAVKMIPGHRLDANTVKAALFTRYLQPYPLSGDGAVVGPENYFLHIGLYAFRAQSLTQFTAWPKGALESAENLEQLRILENGEDIAVGIVKSAKPGIDTPEDYCAFVTRFSGK